MNVLLINDNPVVSRLLVLCTRDANIILEEVRGIDSIKQIHYDVVFIDEDSYEGEVLNVSQNLNIDKKVLLTNADVEISEFDMTIKKPFLPSQIIDVLESLDVSHKSVNDEVKGTSIFPLSSDSEKIVTSIDEDILSDVQVLDADELEKIKSLLEMDEDLEKDIEDLSEEEIEHRKLEVIKEQLIAEGLEIVGEEEMVNELSNEEEIVFFSSDDGVKKKKKKQAENKKSKNKKTKNKKDIAFTERELERIEDAVQVSIASLKRKKMKKLLKGKRVQLNIQLEDIL